MSLLAPEAPHSFLSSPPLQWIDREIKAFAPEYWGEGGGWLLGGCCRGKGAAHACWQCGGDAQVLEVWRGRCAHALAVGAEFLLVGLAGLGTWGP